MKKRNFTYGARSLNGPSPSHVPSNAPKTIKRSGLPEVTIEPTDDEEIRARLEHEADAIRRLASELPSLVSDIAGADLPVSRVRELAGDLLATGASDPLLAVTLAGAVHRTNGVWLHVYQTAFNTREAPAAARFCVDEAGEPINEELSVDLIVPAHRAGAIGALLEGDWRYFFRAPLMHGASQVDLLVKNAGFLREQGLWERAIIYAYTRSGRDRRPLKSLRWLLESADREELRDSGDPLPGPGPFTVYRGVGAAHRLTGPSWTNSLTLAAIFAAIAPGREPSVYVTTVPAEEVFFYKHANEMVSEYPDIIGDHFLAIVAPEAVERVDTKEVRELIRQYRLPPATNDVAKQRAGELLETVL
jgi:hypothetical protein